jgi:hypothetical protein
MYSTTYRLCLSSQSTAPKCHPINQSVYFRYRTTGLFSEANYFLCISASSRRRVHQWQEVLISAGSRAESFEVRTPKRSPGKGGRDVLLDLSTVCCVTAELCSWMIYIWNIKGVINFMEAAQENCLIVLRLPDRRFAELQRFLLGCSFLHHILHAQMIISMDII